MDPVQLTQADGGFRVEIDGKAIPVTLPEGVATADTLRDQYVPKGHVESIVQDRLRRATNGLRKPEELLEDEGFLDQVVTKHKDTLATRLGVKPSDDQLARYREAWEKSHVTPLQAELETTKGTLNGLVGRVFRSDFMAAARDTGVADELADLVELYVKERTKWSPEHNRHFVVDEKGEFRYGAGKDGVPYMTPAEFLAELQRGGKHAAWFKARQRDGVGFQGTGAPGSAGAITLDQFEKMTGAERMKLREQDPAAWQRLMDERRKAGEAALSRNAGF